MGRLTTKKRGKRGKEGGRGMGEEDGKKEKKRFKGRVG